MKDFSHLTPDEKIDYLLQKVEQIDRTVNPPFWKTLLRWIWNHLLTLVILGIIAYLVWEIWGIVQDLILQVDAVQSQFSDIKTSITDTIAPLKFWK